MNFLFLVSMLSQELKALMMYQNQEFQRELVKVHNSIL